MTTLVRLEGTVVAVAGPTRYYLAPVLEARPRGDLGRKRAALMCLYAQRLDRAGLGDEYTDEMAQRFAEYVLELVHAGV